MVIYFLFKSVFAGCTRISFPSLLIKVNLCLVSYYSGAIMADAISHWGTNEDDLKALLVEYGPVVTTINASPLGNYNGGIFSSWTCCDAASGGESCTYVISIFR